MRERVVARLVRPMPDDAVVGWVAPIALFLVALVTRLHRLSVPSAEQFDELYYACDARSLLRHGHEVVVRDRAHGFCVEDTTATYGDFVAHPPLGKWAIALGEQLFGFNSLGWRFSAAVAGALSVLLVARIGRRLLRSTTLGCLAAGVMSFDALHFVQSRIAMLDIFLLLWVVATFGCLVVDRDDARRRLAARISGDISGPGPRLGVRRWRLAAGVCAGAGTATKWSALYFVAALLLLSLAWDVGMRRTAGVRRPLLATLRRETSGLLTVLLVAAVVYVGSWGGWFASDNGWRRSAGAFESDLEDQSHHGALRGLVEYHEAMWEFHQGLTVDHHYESKPETWLLLVRPVAYHYVTPQEGSVRATLGVGSPAVWWGSLLAVAALVWAWVSRRDWRAAALLAVVGAGYLPWFLERERTMFLFYALPLLPFLALALAYCAGWAVSGQSLRGRRLGAAAAGAYVGVVLANFVFLYPVLTAQLVPYDEWRERMLFPTWI